MTAGSGEALRQQLRATMREVWHRIDCGGTEACFLYCDEDAALVNNAIWPLIEAALAAARVATATEIAEALEARAARDAAYPDALTLISVRNAAALAREVGGSVPAPKQEKP